MASISWRKELMTSIEQATIQYEKRYELSDQPNRQLTCKHYANNKFRFITLNHRVKPYVF